jgi:putative PIN family toxin of toxin-antitoxin system
VLAIFDVNVFVSSIVTPGGPADRLVAAAQIGGLELVASSLLLAELDRVLRREKFRRWISVAEVERYVRGVRRMAILVPDPAPAGRWVRDQKDDYLVELARAAGVDLIVSGDKDLLAVDPEVVRVVTPREAVDGMGG